MSKETEYDRKMNLKYGPLRPVVELAVDAISRGRCIKLQNGDIVELHAVGITREQMLGLLCYVVQGDAGPGLIKDLKLITVPRPITITIDNLFSKAPRSRFEKNDKRFSKIILQVRK